MVQKYTGLSAVQILAAMTWIFTAWKRIRMRGNCSMGDSMSATVSASCSRNYGCVQLSRMSWWWVDRGTNASSGIWISRSCWLALYLSVPCFKSGSVTAAMAFCGCCSISCQQPSEAVVLPVLLSHIPHIFKTYHLLLNRPRTQAFEERISVHSGILTL